MIPKISNDACVRFGDSRINGRNSKRLLSTGAPKPDAVVVTVPASFQVAQRMETIKAASLAGLQIDNGDLFDEPVAAYIDYLTTHIADGTGNDIEPGRLLVFDFGGGTCDIAIFQLAAPATNRLIGVSPLSISRFHRLGWWRY